MQKQFFIGPNRSEPMKCRKTAIANWQRLWKANPDFCLKRYKLFTAEDGFAWEIDVIGTFTNPLSTPKGEIPPTGKKVVIHISSTFKVTPEGLISEIRDYYDPDV